MFKEIEKGPSSIRRWVTPENNGEVIRSDSPLTRSAATSG